MAQSGQVTLEIDEESPPEGHLRNNVLHRLDSVSRPVAGNRNNLGFGDRLNSVFREIRPLVEHARMVYYLYFTPKQLINESTKEPQGRQFLHFNEVVVVHLIANSNYNL